ncbi:glycosyltransferase family 1 protein [Dothidotthia symphoricarpi CBS 119687]|uniref:UDP-N-acetylglucosamine transferase subunit ALG14 n=1 Tax=Dothidotthia symphoricarpi CBS 119687 TaxID=1392245 RepID=A0A6A6A8Y9_9PLEO|nr:glycosyltransferase family 1 protein [Dothidotthia symphoricarpi CBS 119687]KAF2127121.1 glycosyltransferase family 1 protein [Dothidotthia symphoricarpi CBS 119687]
MPPPPSALLTLPTLLALLTTLLLATTLRLLAILPRPRNPPHRRTPPPATRVIIVLGSGGHTHEMLCLLRALNTQKYTHRTYVVSSGDAFSAQRAVAFERALEERGDKCTGPAHYTIHTLPRARRVHQSLFTTPFSALRTLGGAFTPLLDGELPGLIITNGPATGVIVVLAVLVLKFFNVRGAQSGGMCRTVYVESFARVRGLSLSGRLLVRVVDRFLVQWEGLEGGGGRAEFWGVLV